MASEDNKFGVKINEATLQFVREHREDDVRQLALHPVEGVDMPFALNQIQGWQTAKKKLPTWAETEGIIYPPHLNMEQCSSEMTARYKQSLPPAPSKGEGACNTLVDLTGGFGVDFSFMARRFTHAVYVERDERLCKIARHNFEVLGLNNVEVVNGDGMEYLENLSSAPLKGGGEVPSNTNTISCYGGSTPPPLEGAGERLLIYLDPARRDANGHKVYGIEDCTPDVLALKDELLAKADCVMIKLSPMLDWHEAVRKLGDCVSEVHIVSVGNECKELLMVCLPTTDLPSAGLPPAPSRRGGEEHTIRLVCVNDEQKFEVNYSLSHGLQCSNESTGSPSTGGGWGEAFLYVPNASIMKAGIFAELTVAFPVAMLDKNSHLFLSDKEIKDFPGRKFRILATTTMNKKELKEKLKGITKANISVRNFPMSVAELRKRLKLKDGGDIYIFATTFQSKHVIFVATPYCCDAESASQQRWQRSDVIYPTLSQRRNNVE